MESNSSDIITSVASGQLGYGVAAFVIPMAAAYILLRVADSSRRKPSTALVLRVMAVVLVLLLAYAGFVGSGALAPGGIAAVLVTIAWALWQQFKARQPAA
jgi:hypothetical protein